MTITTGFVDDDRYDRMRRIDWMDVDNIHSARCLVVGAGALGNETVKNLVLSGFRNITVVDMDDIVLSNLSRCLFFREKDVRTVKKAEIVAERASDLDPDCSIRPMVSTVQELDSWDYDVILGCLDNIKARLHVNSHAYYHGIPYIDGATDGMKGKVSVILDDGPCLQCMMNRSHIREMERRFTCTGNGRVFVPKTASDITTTAIVSGMMVREAMKVASGRKDLCIRNVAYYDGISGMTEVLDSCTDPECPNHME